MARATWILVLLVCCAQEAHAAERTLHGRVLDAAGKPVAGAEVATAWTASGKSLAALRGVTTDAQGRFALDREVTGGPITLLAYDAKRERGGRRKVAASAINEPFDIVLGPLATRSGELTTEAGKFYPSDAVVWLAIDNQSPRCLRVKPDKGDYVFRVPLGSWVMTAAALQCAPHQFRLELTADKAKGELPTVDLGEQEGVRVGDPGPPFRFVEANRKAQLALTDKEHLPPRWTLCYFWAEH